MHRCLCGVGMCCPVGVHFIVRLCSHIHKETRMLVGLHNLAGGILCCPVGVHFIVRLCSHIHKETRMLVGLHNLAGGICW